MESEEDRYHREEAFYSGNSACIYQDQHDQLIDNFLRSMSVSSQQWDNLSWEDQFQKQFENVRIRPQRMEESQQEMIERVSLKAIQFQEQEQKQLPRTNKWVIKKNQQNSRYKFPRLRDNNLKCISDALMGMIRHFQVMDYDQVFQRISRDTGKKKSKKLRRRIYDALNVLKATNAIEVVDKTIKLGLRDQLDQHSQHQPEQIRYANSLQSNQISQQLERIKRKKVQLQELLSYKQSLTHLIETNKARDDEVQQKDRIKFPFFGVNGAGTTISYKQKCVNTKIQNFTEVKMYSNLQLISLLHKDTLENSQMKQ